LVEESVRATEEQQIKHRHQKKRDTKPQINIGSSSEDDPLARLVFGLVEKAAGDDMSKDRLDE
jgi:hypothetical protein